MASLFGVTARCTLCGLLALGCSEPDAYTDPAPSRGPAPPETSTNYALSFDGVDDYVTTATSGFPFSEFSQTLAAWIKLTNLEGQHAVLTMRRAEESGTMLGVEGDQLISYNIFGMRAFVQSDDALTGEQWHHVAFTQEAVESDPVSYTQRLYLDGELVATGDLPPQNRTPIVGYIGAFDSQRSLFEGEIDEVRIYARLLDDEELFQLASDEEPSSESLVALWSFNEPPGEEVAFDRSSFENHATLGDGASPYMPRRVVSDR